MPGKKKPDRPKRPRASKAQVLLRVTEVYRMRLAGAKLLDVQEYVREAEQKDGTPWTLAEGEKPLSEAQICVYIKRADEAIEASTKESRKQSLVKNLARREHLFALAVNAGDVRTALAVADSEAKLRGLFDTPARAAKIKPPKTTEDVLQLLASTVADLCAGRIDNKTAHTIGTLAGDWLRGFGVDVLDKRLEALQAVLLGRKEKKP